MRNLYLILFFVLSLPTVLIGQTYFYVNSITVDPVAPTTQDVVTVSLAGDLSSSGAYVSSTSFSVIGSVVYLTVDCADPGGLAVLVPHTEQIQLGTLAAGNYTIQLSGVGLGDFAPAPQHQFMVSGTGACDSLLVQSIAWAPFGSDTLLSVHVLNQSTTLFDYPGFILFDDNGDTLAIEQVNFFGIAQDSWHQLNVHPQANIPTGAFQGTLELWTGFYTALSCSYPVQVDLCAGILCQDVMPQLVSIGGASVTIDLDWTIVDSVSSPVFSGTFNMVNDQLISPDTVCLAPGTYSLVVEGVNQGPGVLAIALGTTSPYGLSMNYEEDGTDQILSFEFFSPCVSGPNSLREQLPGEGLGLTVLHDRVIAIRFDGLPLGSFSFHDMNGRLLSTGSANSDRAEIPVSNLSAGIYVLRTEVGTAKWIRIAP